MTWLKPDIYKRHVTERLLIKAQPIVLLSQKENFMDKNMFFNAKEVAAILGVSVGHSYKLIKIMNDELKEKGYLTVSGKVPKKYFETRYYGFSAT